MTTMKMTAVAVARLGDFKGSILTDGYLVYEHSAKQKPANEHLLYWAHVRAKFKYAQDYSKNSTATWFMVSVHYSPLP